MSLESTNNDQNVHEVGHILLDQTCQVNYDIHFGQILKL